MEIKIIPLERVVIDLRVRDYCKMPYPNHPKGCPNYGKRKTCPPQAFLFEEIITPPYTLVAVSFDLEAWANSLKKKHPNWSDRQARCCLYWQGKVRKVLRIACEEIVKDNEVILYCPEAMGVHVFNTCKLAGIILERNPQRIVWKVVIIGRKRNETIFY